ncbi:MAG: adenosylmethionine--8-amino-7-oxononanoate transaminase [Epsilonproteobacteria bacterium]|nr:adenosylmethionine--8-amino-7-oxononanoate transaminase [Campylobacterota bacterium]
MEREFGNDYWKNLDLKYIWHPCTQMKDHQFLPLIPIKYGKGIYLYDYDGNRYLDAISSWWVNLFGHSNPKINEAIKKQVDKLEHVIFAGFTHENAIKLSQRLVKIVPKGLKKIFFADNGSSAVEIALKMSYHYHKNRGESRDIFLSLTNSYHGETIGALSVGDLGLYKDIYSPLLLKNIQTPVPKDSTKEAAFLALEELENIVKKYKNKISAFIIEPLIQGAGGMHMYHPIYIKEAKDIIKKYNIHLIADEIMTGFGRSGTMFAIEQSGISPDIMTLSKGITGGYLPLAVVLLTDEIYDQFYCDYNPKRNFLHSHSYSGNPISIAAALKVLDIFEEENILNKNIKKSNILKDNLKRFREFKNIENIRVKGMIGAFDIKGFDISQRATLKVYQYALKNGLLLRPLGNTIYFMPPYIISEEEIEYMVDIAFRGVEELFSSS